MGNGTLMILGISVLLAIFLIVAIYIIAKTKPYLDQRYWVIVLVVTLASALILNLTLYFSGIAYFVTFLVLVLFMKLAAEHMFEEPGGPTILGIYFGFWLSFPFLASFAA
jgi:hypothetical protein